MNFNWIKTALLAATAMVSLNSFSQDLIARQAPIDRKLKSVDSLALQKQIRAEQSLYPGLDLYPNWNNEFVQAYGNAIVPESYTFDLTGFCMPTPNTRITDVFGYRPRRRRAHYGLDIKVYVEADADERILRRIIRDVKERGRDMEGVVEQYLTTVKPMHYLYVEPTRSTADIVINSGMNPIAFELVKNTIQKILDEEA